MMRMMRKMFKRIVSIVMALLVILGTTVYGGSAFAEEAQGQADSASVTFSNDYIYLDPTGMKSEGADWTTNSNTGVCIRFKNADGGDPKIGTYDNGIWKFPVSNLSYGSSKFYFTYISGTNDDWYQIKNNDYYRTCESTLTVDEARGSVVVQNGTTTMDGKKVYTIAVKKTYAGNTLSFVDMTGTLTDIQAQFSLDGNYDDSASEQVTTLQLPDGKVTVPSDVNGKAYQYVRFIDAQNNAITDYFDLATAISKGGILYYGIRQDSSKIYSEWSQEKKSETAPDVTKLYFNNLSFKTSDEITIQIGSGKPVKVVPDDTATNTLSYSISGNNIDKDTIISIKKNGVTYRFYPNGADNLITYSGSNICIKGTYQADLPNTNTVYFDATLSKLSYAGDVTDNSLPLKNADIYYHAWNDTKDTKDGVLTKLDDFSDGTHTWSDVYKADLDKKYSHILFYSSTDGNIPSDNANKTYDLNIPDNLTNPCFYADTSDDSIYKGTKRSGYWEELYTVRDAEGKTKDGDTTTTSGTIVDIPSGTLTRNSDMLYVNTTLYDYYSDYELNGYNRDGYSYHADLKKLGDNPNLHYIYQPFRQFNQALSLYYNDKSASSPIYWGNFQNYNGSSYDQISDKLNLYGSSDWSKFIFNNNSMWGSNVPAKCPSPNNSGVLDNSNNATQGLVSDTLSDNNLMIKTSSGTVKAPYFDESFLAGNNSKNTVLGKVYKGVTFPFVKEQMKSKSDSNANGTVEYWKFDSATSTKNGNLELQHSNADGYFLNPTDNAVYGQTADTGFPDTSGPGKSGKNYFPFNNGDQSGQAAKLNYGFGQKFDLKFKLTSDGTVTTDKNEEVPIEFNFSGDDDVWVFIDGKLVLDVGGGHGVVTGTINFKDKIATVSSVKNDDATKGGAISNVVKNFVDVKEITDEYFTKEHTLTMFYMERGLWESNMSISFNFPDENQFQVEKSVDTTDVNKDIFPDTLFDNASVFPFTIQNQATHFGIRQATAGTVKPAVFNDTFDSSKIQNVYGNKFENCPEKEGQSDVVHWWAADNDEGGKYINRRWGIISPKNDGQFDATYKVENKTQRYKYLQFKFYYDDTYNPSTKYMYIGLEDNNGIQTGKYLTQDIVTINNSLSNKKWITVNVDVSQLVGDSNIDLSKLKYIKFNYDYSRNFYLDDFKFIPSSEVTEPTGFVTKQYDIADYGSVKSGTLMYPENAVYTISSDKSSTTNIMDDDGKFVLANGETATFSDQFRRGSYIALSEDVDTEVFETSWTMYENGEPVTTNNKEGDTVDLTSATTNLTNQHGSTIKDGRKEKYKTKSEDGHPMNNVGLDIPGDSKKTVGYPGDNSKEGSSAWAKKNGDVSTEDANTIVFRSYSDPDNSTIATKLKVKYTNKVKTGTITIQKKKADVSDDLNGEYTFNVKFFNVAGMNLEETKTIETTCSIKKNANGEFEPIVIKGIPAGTQYTISEISADDGAVLESVDTSSGDSLGERYKPKVIYDDTTKLTVVSGAVKADAAEQTKFIFTNKLKPVINIELTKKWNNVSGVTIPDSINIQLQRCVNEDGKWEAVEYATPGQTAAYYRTLGKDKYDPNKPEWTCSFTGLDRYANGDDGTVDKNKPYKYRIVEVTVADGKVEKVIENSEYLNDLFKVTYTDAISASSEETGSSITKKYTITNTYSPLTNIKITKVDATDKSKKLNGVEFKLERLVPDSTSTGGGGFKLDSEFTAITVTTGGTDSSVGTAQGIAEFKDLKDGTYRLTETKTVKGYNLLKNPITIKIKRNQVGETTVDGQPYDFGEASDKNTIELQISNRMKFLLPKTGGYGAMLLILCGMALATLCCLIFFLINLRKEVQYSRHKRQRRNAIGK